ncbi:MAG: hypothetical protein KC731_43295 [Myxococcales bacterium]|nr:hypothetical protein [Myxococcales bacterium]
MSRSYLLAAPALLTLACAATGSPEPGTGGGGSTSTSSSSGVGGYGGQPGVGGGGEGGAGLCGTDCTIVDTPDCYQSVCNDGSYPGVIGSCVVVPVDDGTSCDDGMFCTTDDSCQAGVCTGGPVNDCGLPAEECHTIVCDENADTCNSEPAGNGDPCTSDDLCMLNTTCLNGVCGGGDLNDCFLAPVPNSCHVAVCNPLTGMCDAVPGNDGQGCSSSDLCSVGDTCLAGQCQGGTPKDCSNLTQGCDLGVCDTMTGQCVAQSVMNGQTCDDLDACTTGEICSSGACGGGTAITSCSLVGDGCCPSNCTGLNDLDCQCVTNTLTTSFTNTSGWDGIMFDIVAKQTLEVLSFDSNIDTGAKTIEVYYKAGTFVGFESNSSAWTLAGSVLVSPSAPNIGTPIPVAVNVTIPAGQTYGFYIVSTAGGTLNNGINYILNVPTGSVQTENADLQVLGGKGRGTGFMGSTFVDRGLSGVVHYERCGN